MPCYRCQHAPHLWKLLSANRSMFCVCFSRGPLKMSGEGVPISPWAVTIDSKHEFQAGKQALDPWGLSPGT